MRVTNASQKPMVYFGLHMTEGVAEYPQSEGKPKRFLILENAIKTMNPTFQGCPVYVQHVDEVDLSKVENESAGYVVRSFYNEADGKNWVEFLIVSDKGHDAIRQGWKLSNAYHMKDLGGGGLWHGVQYDGQVMRGEYEHLAIVPNPRYTESIILTPEAFKAYNDKKKNELVRLANSKKVSTGEKKMKFTFWKKETVKNSEGEQIDFSNTMVTLPKSKQDLSIEECIENADRLINMQGYASPDHMVKVGDSEMSVNDLSKAYCDMKNAEDEMKKKNAEEEEKKKENSEGEEEVENSEEKEEVENSEEKEEKEEPKAKNSNLEKLKNAHVNARVQNEQTVSLASDKVARGKSLYGSK